MGCDFHYCTKQKIIEKMTDEDYSMGDEKVEGELKRPEDHFRDWVTKDGPSEYPAVTGRYYLYVSLPPRRIARLLGLEGVVGMTVLIRCATIAAGLHRQAGSYKRFSLFKRALSDERPEVSGARDGASALGFAETQRAYEQAANGLFAALDSWTSVWRRAVIYAAELVVALDVK